METHEGLSLLRQRVGDAERDDCIEYLVENHVAGRLSREEFEVRQAAAHEAVTMSDLLALLADLPDSSTPSSRDIASRRQARKPARHVNRSLATKGVTVGAVVMAAAVVPPVMYDTTGSMWMGMFLGSLITSGTGVVVHRLASRLAR